MKQKPHVVKALIKQTQRAFDSGSTKEARGNITILKEFEVGHISDAEKKLSGERAN